MSMLSPAPEPAGDESKPSAEGLTSPEAAERLRRYGGNEIRGRRRRWLSAVLGLLFANPLALILLAAAAVSAALGDRMNASIIVALVSISFVLGFVQTFRSKQAMRHLENSVAPHTTVRRDGAWKDIPRREIVPGDVARLRAGDLVPADGRLTEEKDLHVNEAALTGESVPAEKAIEGSNEESRVWLGTSVVSGTGTLVVEKTGADTQFGEIAQRLAQQPPATEFERGLHRFGTLIMRVVLLMVGFALLAMLALHRNPLQSLLFAVALAVGLTPEFLPMITTLTLARGAVRMARHKVIVKNLASIQNFGSMDVLCSDKTGTLTTGEMTLERVVGPDGRQSDVVLDWAALNAAFQTGASNSLDDAIRLKAAPAPEWSKVDEIPFDFERRRVSVVAQNGDRRVLIAKGAAEGLVAASQTAKGQPLDQPARGRLLALDAQLGQGGYRVLAVAIREIPVQAAYGIEDETDLDFVGYLAFADPPLPDALEVLHRLRGTGVDLKVVTGDSETVTAHVCRQIGLDPGEIVLGADLDKLNEDAVQALAERTTVFARISPAQKNRIILALKTRGHVVGYMGDGINDAPSLHTADVGISFAGATDVAKDAAQIVMVERSLSLLHKGVLEGRMAFGNVMKYLFMETSSNFGNMLSMAGAAAYLPFLPMLPTQILLNNLLYDVSQIAIPADRVDGSYIRKPKRWDIRLIRDFMVFVGPISSIFDFLTFGVLLHVFKASEAAFHTGWFVESLATQTLVVFVIRTRDAPWKSRPSRPLFWTAILVVSAAVAIPFAPLAHPLGFVPLPASFFVFVIVATVIYLAAVEGVKRWLFRRYDA